MWKQSYHFILVLQCFNQHPFMRRLNPNKKSRRATLNMSSWSTKEWTKTTNVLLFMPQSGNIPCKKWHTLQCYSLLQCWKFFKLRSSVRMFSKIYQMVKSTYLAAKWLGGGLIKQEVKLDNTYGILKDKMNKKVFRTLRTLLSPVTTMTRMPAVIHESMAFLTSSLGGSSIPTYIRDNRNPETKKVNIIKQTYLENRAKSRQEKGSWSLLRFPYFPLI